MTVRPGRKIIDSPGLGEQTWDYMDNLNQLVPDKEDQGLTVEILALIARLANTNNNKDTLRALDEEADNMYTKAKNPKNPNIVVCNSSRGI